MSRLFQVVSFCGISILLSSCGPSIKEFEYLKEPKIMNIPDQKMITAELKGSPDEISGKAIKALYKVYFSLKEAKEVVAPRARWSLQTIEKPMSEWIGQFALPISETIEQLPPQEQEAGIEVKIDKWQYGEVAEILHVGRYDNETATIEKLHKFIKDSGYKINGPHEEEYIKGPGIFFKGNPDKYMTIIRYQVTKETPKKQKVTKKKRSK